jgi:hypothetical protein
VKYWSKVRRQENELAVRERKKKLSKKYKELRFLSTLQPCPLSRYDDVETEAYLIRLSLPSLSAIKLYSYVSAAADDNQEFNSKR